jgi:hypothetical protein
MKRVTLVTLIAVALFWASPAQGQSSADNEGGWGSAPNASATYHESGALGASEIYRESGTEWGTITETLEGTTADMGPTLPGPPSQVPVDGGLSLLALAGAGFAARRLRKRGQDSSND